MSYNNEYSSNNNNDDYSSSVCTLLISYLDRATFKLCGPIISLSIPLLHVNHHFFQAFVSNFLICRVAKVVSMTEPLVQVATV
jgi:hypothetical protein